MNMRGSLIEIHSQTRTRVHFWPDAPIEIPGRTHLVTFPEKFFGLFGQLRLNVTLLEFREGK